MARNLCWLAIACMAIYAPVELLRIIWTSHLLGGMYWVGPSLPLAILETAWVFSCLALAGRAIYRRIREE